ncbi:MAG: hypothetical protein ACTHU0_39495 [Kofleriaceae bacterium]
MPLPPNVTISHYAGTATGDAVEVVYLVDTGLPGEPPVSRSRYLSDAALVARAARAGGSDWGLGELEEELALQLATPPAPPVDAPAPAAAEPETFAAQLEAEFPGARPASEMLAPSPTT